MALSLEAGWTPLTTSALTKHTLSTDIFTKHHINSYNHPFVTWHEQIMKKSRSHFSIKKNPWWLLVHFCWGPTKKASQGFALVQPTHLGVVQLRVRVDMFSIQKNGFDQQRSKTWKQFFLNDECIVTGKKNINKIVFSYMVVNLQNPWLNSTQVSSFVFGKPLVGSTRCRMSRLNTHALFESLMKTSGGSLLLEKASQAAVENDATAVEQDQKPMGSMYGIFTYIHLPWKSTKCSSICHTWILWGRTGSKMKLVEKSLGLLLFFRDVSVNFSRIAIDLRREMYFFFVTSADLWWRV